ncbi:MAG: pyridoxal-dependent decarboxylase [Bacteroidota bacterium]
MNEELNKWFISPNSENQAYVTQFFEKIIEQLVHEKGAASQKELVPNCTEESSMVDELDHSHTMEQVLEQLQLVYQQSMNASSVGYIGQMDSIPNLGAIIGDLVTAAINNNMLANEMSPLLSWLELQVVNKFVGWFGFGEGAGGIMTSGGTLANIQALTVARNVKLNITDGNLFKVSKEPVLFTSEHSHASIAKAGMLLGIGTGNVVKVKTDGTGKMSIPELREQISQAIQAGKQPFAVVSTFGTTNSGSLDDVAAIQALCEEYDLWHHVDAIYGGALALSASQAELCPAFHQADSLSFNPQKWMFVSKTCSVLILKDFQQLDTHFKIPAPYVQDGNKLNLGEYGIQGSRHGSILKLWLSLYLIGKDKFAEMIDLNMEISQRFTDYISQHDDLQLYTEPDSNIILFRPIKREGQIDSSYQEFLSAFQQYLYSHNHYISLIPWEGESWLKCIFLNPYFNHKELESLQVLINQFFKEVEDSLH